MVDCERFLAEYSAFRDGELSWAESEAFEAHIDECPSCARYDRVIDRGAEVFRALPELEVSEDFMERLQHRLYHVDEERSYAARRASGRTALASFAVAAGIAAAAWVPLMARQAGPEFIRLPAVAVQEPAEPVIRPLATDPRHTEAGSLTSQLARLGVAVYELPYHDLVFREDGPLGSLASNDPPAAAE